MLLRATVRWTFPIGSGGGTNTWHLRTVDPSISLSTTTDLNVLMTYIKDFYFQVMKGCPTGTTVAWNGTALQINSEEPSLVSNGTPWTLPGAGGTASYGAAPVMACVTWRTSLATRSGRGRTFCGPLTPSVVEANGTLSTTYMGQLQTGASALVAASTTTTNGAVGIWSGVLDTFRDITGHSITDQAAVLRSRR